MRYLKFGGVLAAAAVALFAISTYDADAAKLSGRNVKIGCLASLTGKGLKPQSVLLTGEMAKIQLNAVSFAGIVDWLQDAQKTLRLSVVDASVEAQQKPDTVNASLTLRQQGGGQSQ